jgi:hypothetical protein
VDDGRRREADWAFHGSMARGAPQYWQEQTEVPDFEAERYAAWPATGAWRARLLADTTVAPTRRSGAIHHNTDTRNLGVSQSSSTTMTACNRVRPRACGRFLSSPR